MELEQWFLNWGCLVGCLLSTREPSMYSASIPWVCVCDLSVNTYFWICLQDRRPRFDPWVRKSPWRREWHPTPVFLPGKSMDRGAWQATVHGFTRVGHDLVTKPPPPLISERCPGPTSSPVNQNFLGWSPRQVYNEKPPLFVFMLTC